jgi:alanyl-tRNA synthetase
MMTSAEIRHSFLEFFRERGHAIVPSSPVVPFDDPTLLFTNAGMNQFKDVFLGQGKRSYSRAADTQKCIRVSGKHNDLEEVGRDTYHHTFFEMLGNWSFGDYYKKEAIRWSWDLLTSVWGLPKERLWATVYKDDDEAEQLWRSEADIDPDHILRFGEKDNFWEMGETGPCGPCSEIHIDRTPGGTATASMVNAGIPEVMEIWNLVFIQYNRDASGTLHLLPAKHVDTGMGFERVCALLQNKDSNYDSDVFTPLIKTIADTSGKAYDGRMTGVSPGQLDIDTAMRVIADHIRALTFAIADSAIPSNEGRGYVLRRLLRRAARFGRNLGLHEPFLFRLVPTLTETMGDVFPEIREKQEHIQKTIRGEEEAFNSTLDRGLDIFEQTVRQIGTSKSFPGAQAFKLYDTYGFPLDLTELLATERGLRVDVDTFNELMEEQRRRSRAAEISQEDTDGSSGVEFARNRESARTFETDRLEGKSAFVGYDRLRSEGIVLSAKGNLLILDQTPFYGEAGGQVGDQGEITLHGNSVRVLDTQKSGNINVHILQSPIDIAPGSAVHAEVDAIRRQSIMRNHTATHLLHAALRRILGTHVHQAGSLVAPDHLRFDFTHSAKVSEDELKAIEELVNEKIHDNIKLIHHRNIPFEEAKKMGALMFFGDKYGDRVNVVEFSEFSKEFCGGTHVSATGDIGYFKFRSEGSAASGVRRVEAATSEGALQLLAMQGRSTMERIDYAAAELQELRSMIEEAATKRVPFPLEFTAAFASFEARLSVLRQSLVLPQTTGAGLGRGFELMAQREMMVEEFVLDIAEKRKAAEREISRTRLQSQAGLLDDLIAKAGETDGIKVVSSQVDVRSIDELKLLGDALRAKLGHGVGLLAAVADGKVSLVCVVTDDLVTSKKLQAGKIVGAVAKLVGGGGGGKAHLATAGGKDPSQLPHALAMTQSIVRSQLETAGVRG